MQTSTTASLILKPRKEAAMKSIVIDREYGSGGREVAKILAQKLGIQFYDGNLLQLAGEYYGVDMGAMRDFDEKGTGSFLHDIALASGILAGDNSYNKPYQVYDALSRVIKNLAMEQPGIFLGRCADQVLKGTVPVLHVYIYASDMQDKITRAKEVDGIPEQQVGMYIKRKDAQRKNYRRFFGTKDANAMPTYDLCLNTSTLGYEKAAEAIMAVLQENK